MEKAEAHDEGQIGNEKTRPNGISHQRGQCLDQKGIERRKYQQMGRVRPIVTTGNGLIVDRIPLPPDHLPLFGKGIFHCDGAEATPKKSKKARRQPDGHGWEQHLLVEAFPTSREFLKNSWNSRPPAR